MDGREIFSNARARKLCSLDKNHLAQPAEVRISLDNITRPWPSRGSPLWSQGHVHDFTLFCNNHNDHIIHDNTIRGIVNSLKITEAASCESCDVQWDSSAARSYGRGTRSDNSREQSNPTTELTSLQRQSPLAVIANNVLDHWRRHGRASIPLTHEYWSPDRMVTTTPYPRNRHPSK